MKNLETQEILPLRKFREKSQKKGYKFLETALRSLEWEAHRIVRIYASKPKRLRPSLLANNMRQLEKYLKSSAKLIQEMEEQGTTLFAIASESMREPVTSNYKAHIAYLDRMARLAKISSDIALSHSKSQRDNVGGRQADENLRSLVVILMHLLQDMLPVEIIRTVNPESGLGESVSDYFIKEAIKSYAPEWGMDDYKIDHYIKWALESRNFELLD